LPISIQQDMGQIDTLALCYGSVLVQAEQPDVAFSSRQAHESRAKNRAFIF
jgi:hypothetical protein